MSINRTIGTIEMKSDPVKLATCPSFSTTSCPKKFDKVAPKPKKEAVSPTENEVLDSTR